MRALASSCPRRSTRLCSARSCQHKETCTGDSLPIPRSARWRYLQIRATVALVKGAFEACRRNGLSSNITVRRSKCCHPFPKDSMLRFMDAILKISNHIVLILPDGACFSRNLINTSSELFAAGNNLSKEQQSKAKELSQIAWPDGNPPSYAEVLYQPNFCGKWKACAFFQFVLTLAVQTDIRLHRCSLH